MDHLKGINIPNIDTKLLGETFLAYQEKQFPHK
jgi:hypothetical protein